MGKATAATREVRIGADRVHSHGDRVVVVAHREMPDWKVTRFRRTAIVYRGTTYFVAGVQSLGRHAFEYQLTPWPANLTDRPSHTFHYNAAFVAERDAGRGKAWAALLIWPLLQLANPFYGLLWNRLKLRLEPKLGIAPGRATSSSILAEYVLALATVLFGYALIFEPSLAPSLTPVRAIVIGTAILADAALRWDHRQVNPHEHLGIGEWLITRWRRPRAPGLNSS